MQKRQINSNRNDRVASKVQTLVAEILRDDYAEDALISGVSLVGAVAHGGLQFVKLFFVTRNTDVNAVQKKLDSETRAIRFELARRMNQKYVPEIKFTYDDTMERAARIDELLDGLITEG
ncbi:MAG: ribosome-binding factor A [Alphaproteobacteria bacterium]|nr:ribosome-binding factor A [Alphaproteobacteria bacterium]